jgi:hypothetical protein
MSSLFDTIVNYIRKYKDEPNSLVTLETHNLCDQRRRGTITMKWWQENQILFITHIQLESVPMSPKHILSNTMTALRNVENLGLQTVKLVGVGNSVLSKKLQDKNWYQEDAGNLVFNM